MTTVVQPNASPIVSFRLVFRAGSWDDPAGQEGLTWLTTRLMAEGGTEKLSPSELSDALYPIAAELSADCDKELTVFSGRVHKEQLERYLEIFTDVLLHPRLDPKELERLRASQVHVLRDVLPNEADEWLSHVALDSLLYRGHPYQHPEQGTLESAQKLTLEQVKEQRTRIFTQDRLVIGLAGAVDDALATRVKTILSALPKTGAPPVTPPPATGPRGKVWILEHDTLSTAGFFGASYDLRRGDPDYFAVALGLSYLGEHRQQHGLLFRELREKRGLNYGTYAYGEHYEQAPGPAPATNDARSTQEWSIWLRPVEPKNGALATHLAITYLEQTIHQPIPAERFEGSRGFLLGATRLWAQTDQRRLGWAIDELLYGTPHFLDDYRAALQKLTPRDVEDALARHLDPEALNFVYVTKDGEALRQALLQEPRPYDIRSIELTPSRTSL